MPPKVKLDDVASEFISRETQRAIEGSVEGSIEYKREDPKVRDARLEREREDARFERYLRFFINIVGILMLVGVFTVCSYVLIGTYSIDEKRLAQPILTAAVGVITGYVFAKIQNK